jgi:hypothetical protein
MPTYNAQGQYVDEQGNPAPNPADASPGISQGIANLLGMPFTPGRDSGLPHETPIDPVHAPQALEGGKSGWGTYMPIQKGMTGAATPALGIQDAINAQEAAIEEETGMQGDVWDNVNLGASDPEGYYPSLEGASIEGDPSGAPPKMAGRTPPEKPEAPAAPEDLTFDSPFWNDLIHGITGYGDWSNQYREEQENRMLPNLSPIDLLPGLPTMLAGGAAAGGRLTKAISDIVQKGLIGPQGRVRSVPLGFPADKARQAGASAAGSVLPVGNALEKMGGGTAQAQQPETSQSQAARKRRTGSAQ